MALILIILQITGSPFHVDNPPMIFGAGGPDDYGYCWIDSDTTGGPTYNWIDISSIGTQITGLADDNVVGPFQIGFDFPYYWYQVNSFYVGSNGYIAFGDNTMEASPFPTIPNTAKPNNFLAPLMSDLDFTVGSAACYYWTNSAQDTFIIAYHDVQFWNSGGSLNTFEIILTRADSSIIFQYQTQQGTPSNGWDNSLTVGIENITGTVGLQYNHDQQPAGNAIHDDLAVLFYPPDTTTYVVNDVSVMKMMNDISGGFFVYNGDTIEFWGVVKNTGNQIESGFDVYCEVKDPTNTVIFGDTINVGTLNPGDTDSLVFAPSWSSTTDGIYSLKVKSLLSGDMVSDNDSIFVEFKIVTYPVELYYDVGYAHTGYAWNGANSGYGAKFVPPIYPTFVNMARFFVSNTSSFPNVTVQILDDDGSNGDPGTVIYETVVNITMPNWYEVDLLAQNIEITDGAFYIGCITDMAQDPYFGMDTLFPSGRQSWEYTGSWAPYRDKETQDIVIHAVVGLVGIEETMELIPGYTSVNTVASPNPFSKLTAITISPNSNEMAIYDASGRLIRHLKVDNGIVCWNGCDDAGQKMNQGVYFAVSDNDEVLKLILVK